MSQRIQSVFFFLSALAFGLLLFLPLAIYHGEYNILQFNVFGVSSLTPDAEVPFGKIFALPVLILTITVMLLSIYVSVSIFKAVRVKQFEKLLRISRIDIVLNVVWIALVYAFYVIKIGQPINAKPVFQVGIFLPLAALVFMLIASSGLLKDIKKVRSVDRIR